MANPTDPGSGGQKPFAEFLRGAPRHQGETVALSGNVAQSDKEGHFVLDLGGGQTVELPVEAVRNYKAGEQGGPVHLDIDREALKNLNLGGIKPILQDIHTLWWLDHHKTVWLDPKPIWSDPTLKEVVQDPQVPGGHIPDPGPLAQAAAAAAPFVLATANQAPAQALAMQGLSGQVKPVVQDTRTLASSDVAKTVIHDHTIKELIKEAVHDPTLKELIHDTIKELSKDPIQDTVKEVFETLVEGGGTIAEGGGGGTLVEGGGFPGGGGGPQF